MWRAFACFRGAGDCKAGPSQKSGARRACQEPGNVDSVRPDCLKTGQGNPGFGETGAASAAKPSPGLHRAERGGYAVAGAVDVPHACHVSPNPDKSIQGLMRDALVLSNSIASITMFTLAGRVLHQNDASRQLLGDLVRDGSLLATCSSANPPDAGTRQRILLRGPDETAPSCGHHQNRAGGRLPPTGGPEAVLAADGSTVAAGAGEDDANVLASIFALEPDKLEELLWQISNNGGVWRGVVRVPCMLMVSTPTPIGLFPADESEMSGSSDEAGGGPGAAGGAGSSRPRAVRQGQVCERGLTVVPGGRGKDRGAPHATRPAAPSTASRLVGSLELAVPVSLLPAELQAPQSRGAQDDLRPGQQQRQPRLQGQKQQHHQHHQHHHHHQHHRAGNVEMLLGVLANGSPGAAPNGDTHTADTEPSQVDLVYENAVHVSLTLHEGGAGGAGSNPRTRSGRERSSCPRFLNDGSGGGALPSAVATASASARHLATRRSTPNTLTPSVHSSFSQHRRGSLNNDGSFRSPLDSHTSLIAVSPYGRYDTPASASSLSTSVFALILGATGPEPRPASAAREPSLTAAAAGARATAAAVVAGRSDTGSGFLGRGPAGPRAKPKRSVSLFALGERIRAAEEAAAGGAAGGTAGAPQVPGRASALAVSTSTASITGRCGPAVTGAASGNLNRSRALTFATSLRTAPDIAALLPSPTSSSIAHSHVSGGPPGALPSPEFMSRGMSFDVPSSARTAGYWRRPFSPPATHSGLMERVGSSDRVELGPAANAPSVARALAAHRPPGPPTQPPAPQPQCAPAYAQTHAQPRALARPNVGLSAPQPKSQVTSHPEGDHGPAHSSRSASVRVLVDHARRILMGTAAQLYGKGGSWAAAPGASSGGAAATAAAAMQDATVCSCPSVASYTDYQSTLTGLTGTTSRSSDVAQRPPHFPLGCAPDRSCGGSGGGDGGARWEPLQATAITAGAIAREAAAGAAGADDGGGLTGLGGGCTCGAPLAKCTEEISLVLSDAASCGALEDPASRTSDPVAPPRSSRSPPATQLAPFPTGTAAAAGAAAVPTGAAAAAATGMPAPGRSALSTPPQWLADEDAAPVEGPGRMPVDVAMVAAAPSPSAPSPSASDLLNTLWSGEPSGEPPAGFLQQCQQLSPPAPPVPPQQQPITSACREVTARIAGMSNAPGDDSTNGRRITAVVYGNEIDDDDEDDDDDGGGGSIVGGGVDTELLPGARPWAPQVPKVPPPPPRLGSTAARVAELRREAAAQAQARAPAPALAAAAAQGWTSLERPMEPQFHFVPRPFSLPPDETYHEVWATPSIDPVTKQPVVILSQHDVTAKVLAERHLALVMETEHRLLEQLFPRHILQYITEEWTCEAARMATATAAPANGFLPAAWRPAVRDCNALATCHPQVTLLFADIKGFTPMCKEVEPRAVMGMLNDLFSRFDANIDKYGVCKVETIGDCYFVAGGLLREDEDGMAAVQQGPDHQHADRVFEFGKAMLKAASQVPLPTTGEAVALRIGLHTGPVVSGVVGTRMPRFCLFGDTVNTASRMESTGVPGAIHVSETTYELLRDKTGWMPTGGIEVKGKGLMQTYLWQPQL